MGAQHNELPGSEGLLVLWRYEIHGGSVQVLKKKLKNKK